MYIDEKSIPELFWSLMYFLLFFLPGFIIQTGLRKYDPSERKTEKSISYGAVLYSLINFAAFSWLYFPNFSPQQMVSANWEKWILFILALVIPSYITKFFLSLVIYSSKLKSIGNYLLKIRPIKAVYKWLGLKPQRLSNTAWDDYFNAGKPVFIVVYLKDHPLPIMGFFDKNSFAGDIEDNHDLYLASQGVYNKNTNSIERIKVGMYIPQDSIDFLLFVTDINSPKFLNEMKKIFTGD